jgi:hypothetical protein
MDDWCKEDKRRKLTGKPYQLFLFESHHFTDIYDINAEDEEGDANSLLMRLESDNPFMPIHVGDVLDGRPLCVIDTNMYRVERIEHQIWLPEPDQLIHRMVLFVSTESRNVNSD